jgi:putative tricarboxylic transport membrane protein
MFLGALLCSVAVVWIWLVNTQIPDVAAEGEPGPRAIPFLLGILLAILGLVIALSRPEEESSQRQPRDWRAALTTVALLVVYAYALGTLGFISSTTLLMLAAMGGVLAMRRWVFMVLFSIAFAAGTWLVFNTVLGIPLPRDPWLQ